MRIVRSWIRWSVPASAVARGEAELRAATFMVFVGPLGGIVVAGWCLLYFLVGFPWPAYCALIPVIIAGLTAPLVLRWGLRPSVLGTTAAVLLIVGLTAPAIFSGGVGSFLSPWFLLIPYLVVVAGARWSWRWLMAGSALLMAGLGAMEGMGILPEPVLPYTMVVHLLSWLSAWLLMAAAVIIHQRIIVTSLASERALSASLMDEVASHRQTQARLQVMHDELVKAARVAGMAEVANGVLHNVGNGLNAVNVSVTLLAERHAKDHAHRFAELADKVEANEVSAAQCVGYMRTLARLGAEAHRAHLVELRTLRQHVEHVNTVVRAQQTHARHGGLREVVVVSELVDDALVLVRDRTASLRIVKDLEVGLEVATDRHKVMQILLNLLTNAVDAVAGATDSEVTIHSHATPDGCVVSVRDNGPGIPPDCLEAIFRHGYTTKPDGHGFGLHTSGVAAMELGGRLVAQNDATTGGALFVLTLDNLAPRTANTPEGHRSHGTGLAEGEVNDGIRPRTTAGPAASRRHRDGHAGHR